MTHKQYSGVMTADVEADVWTFLFLIQLYNTEEQICMCQP